MKKQIFPKTLKGKSVPEFSLPDRNEKVYSMKELSKGKKCVLIDFWASWCGPCRKSIPFLKKMFLQKSLTVGRSRCLFWWMEMVLSLKIIFVIRL